jgi:hypothetical protein
MHSGAVAEPNRRQAPEARYGVESPEYRRLMLELAEQHHLRILGPPAAALSSGRVAAVIRAQ